jgi:fluoroacetyl-CoA thioesterase
MTTELFSPGLTHEVPYVVTAEMSPPHVDGILSTSRMIGLIEDACLEAIQPLVGNGQITVGTRVDVTHIGTAREGEEVTVRIRLAKVTHHRLLSFEVSVEAPDGIISTGIHQRLVVERSRFARR